MKPLLPKSKPTEKDSYTQTSIKTRNMTSLGFGVVPPGVLITPSPFTLCIPQADLIQLNTLAQSALIAPPSFYTIHNSTSNPPSTLGVTNDWISAAVSAWTDPTKFDWRSHESQANYFPQFTINVTAPSDNQVFYLHFAALFSRKPDAIPIIFNHGWPSSWLDYLGMLKILTEKYTPETLPYHIITPSIPDYGLSTRSNLTETELDFWKAAEALNELMKALGFGSGYIAQGGDVGSGLVAALGGKHDECKAVHFNNMLISADETAKVVELNLAITPEENASLADGNAFFYSGTGYLLEHGTRPGTISIALTSNPVSLLAWIGQMYAESGINYSFDEILTQISWYWLTKSYSRSLWAYRAVWEPIVRGAHLERLPSPLVITKKPLGYSWFPKEVLTNPKSWVEHWFPGNLVFFRRHASGGHFAALDEPEGFLQDIEEFVEIVKGKVQF